MWGEGVGLLQQFWWVGWEGKKIAHVRKVGVGSYEIKTKSKVAIITKFNLLLQIWPNKVYLKFQENLKKVITSSLLFHILGSVLSVAT